MLLLRPLLLLFVLLLLLLLCCSWGGRQHWQRRSGPSLQPSHCRNSSSYSTRCDLGMHLLRRRLRQCLPQHVLLLWAEVVWEADPEADVQRAPLACPVPENWHALRSRHEGSQHSTASATASAPAAGCKQTQKGVTMLPPT